MIRFNIIAALPVWSVIYYIFLFLHVYSNIFFIIYSSVWGFLSFKQQQALYATDLIFILIFFKYLLW